MTFWVFFTVVTAVPLGLGIRAIIKQYRKQGTMGDVMGMYIWFAAATAFAVILLAAHFL